MTVETSTTISGLNPTWPLGSDPRSEGDNHIRLVKAVLQAKMNDSVAGLIHLLEEHVYLGTISPTKQGIQFDDTGDHARWRVSADATNALANGLIEMFDNTATLKRSIVMGVGPADNKDGTLLHTGNAFYNGALNTNVDFPLGSYIIAQWPAGGNIARNAIVAVALSTVTTGAFEIVGAGTALTGSWCCRGGFGPVGTASIYLMQRVL